LAHHKFNPSLHRNCVGVPTDERDALFASYLGNVVFDNVFRAMKIRFIMLGKTRREEIRALVDDYAGRIRHYAEIEISELREATPAALRKLKLDPAGAVVLLDAGGKQFTSQEFARWMGNLRDRGTRQLVFLCGDAEGFPDEIRAAAKQKISLSTLTMPHELARVVLAEQIYRAFAILAGHPYPK
jgi:23S rRNA (pseudouridine1915-N3)-methyltransferase